MKRIIAILMLVVMIGCTVSGYADEATDQTLVQIAQEVVDSVAAVYSNEDAIALFTNEPEVTSMILDTTRIWHFVGKARRAVILTVSKEWITQNAPKFVEYGAPQIVFDHLDCLMPRLLSTPANMLNGMISISWLAATSIMTGEDVRVLTNAQPGYALVLLDCGGTSMALVSFAIKEDGATQIRASFIKTMTIPEIVFSLDGKEMGTVLNTFASEWDLPTIDYSFLNDIHFAVYQY